MTMRWAPLASSVMLPLLASSASALQQPAWDWEPSSAQISEYCLPVPSVPGVYYNSNVTWRNNSRLLYLAVPEGSPPAGGWPVLIDLLTVDYPAGLYASSARTCGLQGKSSDAMDDAPPPQRCVDGTRAACAAAIAAGYFMCERCVNAHVRNMSKAFHRHNETGVDCSVSQRLLPGVVCPKAPPIEPVCARLLNSTCPIAQYTTTRTCAECVSTNVTHAHNRSYPLHNKMPCARNMTNLILTGYCKENGPNTHGGDLPGNVRSFKPFDSPHSLGMQCSCINGSAFSCAQPFDDGQHGHGAGGGGFIPHDGSCDDDVFFGGLWHQRLKQGALSNGIAVLEANDYVRDGWESWGSIWRRGYDPPFFKALSKLLGGADSPPLFKELNRDLLTFRGWSGGANAVSWLIDRAARGQLPGLGIAAGVMMAGGSHRCYDEPSTAIGTCASCNIHQAHYSHNATYDPTEPTHNSNTMIANGSAPECDYCCPRNYTEDYYSEHPEEYEAHPFTLLGQTEVDQMADSSAARNYHEGMVSHGAGNRSLAMYLPLSEQRCGCLGAVGGVGVPAADTFGRFCGTRNETCLNHTQGFPQLVEPGVEFLLRAFKDRRQRSTSNS